MSPNVTSEINDQPTTLQEAINIIKFLTTTHKIEIAKLRESNQKQADVIKKLEANRRKELEYLSNELHKYEVNLAERTESVSKQLAEKDEIIQTQIDIIEDLTAKLKEAEEIIAKLKENSVPEITVLNVDSNSDSGIAMENEESLTKNDSETKPEVKTRKCRRFADSISFLRRVDFSPMKYKPSTRDVTPKHSKKDDSSRKNSLDVPFSDSKVVERHPQRNRHMSDDERHIFTEVFSDSSMEPFVLRPKKMNDSMNNHFSDDGSDDTTEEVFDRVMTRSSVRRSVKANPKYKKISRTKSKLLEQVKVNIVD